MTNVKRTPKSESRMKRERARIGAHLATTTVVDSLSPQRSAGRGLGRGAFDLCLPMVPAELLLSPTLSSTTAEERGLVVMSRCARAPDFRLALELWVWLMVTWNWQRHWASVAQLDRASDFGSEGCRFESCPTRQQKHRMKSGNS